MRISFLLAVISTTLAAPTTKGTRQSDTRVNPDRYIVKLKGDTSTLAANDLKASLSKFPEYDYSMTGFRGFAGNFTDEEVARLQASDQVCCHHMIFLVVCAVLMYE